MAYAQFERVSVLNPTETARAGRNVYREGYQATILIDDKNNYKITWAAGKPVPLDVREHFLSQFESWKAGEEHIEGTLVGHLPGVTPAQIDNMKSCGVRTIEDLAAATAAQVEKIGMGGVKLRQSAQAYLDSQNGVAAQGVSDLATENELLKAELEALRQQIAEPAPDDQTPIPDGPLMGGKNGRRTAR